MNKIYPSADEAIRDLPDGGRFEKYREAWDLLRLGAPTSIEDET